MALYKRGRVWWMYFTYRGKFIRKSTGTGNTKRAEKIHSKVVTEIEEGRWFDRLPGEKITFKEMMDKYMAEHSEPKKASAERDRSSLTHLLPYFKGYIISGITPSLINKYKTRRRGEEASPSTVNRELALMKHAFSLAIKEWEWVRENPVRKVSMEKEGASRDRWLTREEEEKLLTPSPVWLKEIIIFAIETGCRRGEILTLEWKDVDLFKRTVIVFGEKTGERRVIPLTQKTFELLKARERARANVRPLKGDFVFTYPAGRKVNIHTLRTAFEAAVEKAKIEGFRFHDLRHTFASRLAQSGTDPYTIQRLMGHKSFVTTQRYAHHYSESLRKGIAALDEFRQQKADFITILSQSGENRE